MILPRNLNPSFSKSVSYFTYNAFVLDPFSYIHAFKLLFHMLELGFILCFPCFIAMNTDSHVHASLNMILFNDRFEYVCLEELCLITCLHESFMLVLLPWI